ncbi:MAG: hypothetical protein N2043_00515 [Ignavibacterium sp.]|nr:hypothetical protein [Ignavibacterium sp.]
MNNEINILKEFISNNPPTGKSGKHLNWDESRWQENIDNLLPQWRELLKDLKVWTEIKKVRPQKNYSSLLKVILMYAPDQILADYLKSSDFEEKRSAYEIIMENNGSRLTTDLWKFLDKDTKSWLISKVLGEIRSELRISFWRDFDIFLSHPDDFIERVRELKYPTWIYPFIFTIGLAEVSGYETIKIIHPLFWKLEKTVEYSDDLFFMNELEKIKQTLKERVQNVIEVWKTFCHTLRGELIFTSKNIMIDFYLLFDHEKAVKTFRFIEEYQKRFNFFISHSFYEFLVEYENSNINFAEYFDYEGEINIRSILGLLIEYRNYFEVFKIQDEIFREKYSDIYEGLFVRKDNKWLNRIFFEEWVFLQEYSWIVSSTKKTFDRFKDAGAVVIEFSEKATQKLIRRTLKKKDDDFISDWIN